MGGVDWNLRDFHGYTTERGSTYNAYLIVDEKIALVDTVKYYLVDELIERVKEVVDPASIDYIISNHTEMDHSGGLTRLAALCPKAKILASANGVKNLSRHFPSLQVTAVADGETLSLGRSTVSFHYEQMVHWPDNMATYHRESKILFSNDAFGQHIASAERFDDEYNGGVLMEEAAKYYANIVWPYGAQVQKVLTALGTLAIDIIAPSHGIIWRSMIADIMKKYWQWARNETKNTAVITYDTMWQSTALLAKALMRGLEDAGVPTTIYNAAVTPSSDIITAALEAKIIAVGSSTLNNNMLPTVAGFLTYLKGLAPKNRTGFAFGSYGWGGQAPKQIHEMLAALEWSLPVDALRVQFIPTEADIERAREAGRALAASIQG